MNNFSQPETWRYDWSVLTIKTHAGKSKILRKKALHSGRSTIQALSESDVICHASQKGVDMKVGLDVATLAYKKIVEKIVLISGDSDFVSASKLARREGIEFILDSINCTIKAQLQEHIDALNTMLPYKK